MQHLTARELKTWLEDSGRTPPVVVDVREPWELQLCALPGALHIPMGNIPGRQQELDPDADIVFLCHHGMRSLKVASYLEHAGFTHTFNLSGGIDAWAREVDPAMPTY